MIRGEIRTNDALIAGQVSGTMMAASRLELQATARVDGKIRARRLQLEKGAVLNGEIEMGEIELGSPPKTEHQRDQVEASKGLVRPKREMQSAASA